MSALLERRALTARDDGCPDGWINNGGWCYSPWDLWGRWVLLGAIVLVAFLAFLIFSCITARRRRRMGQRPIMGTGWVPGAGAPQYGAYGGGYPNQPPPQGWQQPPPQYGAQDGSHYGKTEPQPYGGQQSGSVEMQPPGQSYGQSYGQRDAGEPVYAAPQGPPPGKQ